MPRYVAFLRGVSPMNAKMPALKAAFESAGFTQVRTVLSSGNVIFDARGSALARLEARAEEAMQAELGSAFATLVRSASFLQELLQADPFAEFDLPSGTKRVVTFLRNTLDAPPRLPIERGTARVLKLQGREVFSVYVPDGNGPVFMTLLERTFGKDITTRTLDTVRRCASA